MGETHYFLGNRLLATSPKKPWWSDTQQSFCNEVFICPTCGDAWGRVLNGAFLHYSPVTRHCLRHGSGDDAGSFIATWRKTFDEMPTELLSYELHIRLERFSK